MAQPNDGSPPEDASAGAIPQRDPPASGPLSAGTPAAGAGSDSPLLPASPAPPPAASPPAAPPEPAAAVPPAQPPRNPTPKATARGGRRAPPPPKPGMKPSRSARHPAVTVGSGIFTFLLFLAVGGGLFAWQAERAFYAPGPLKSEKVVNIPRGAGVRDMSEILEREGVIDNWLYFILGQRYARPDASFKAGEYVIKPGQSVASVIDTLASGKVVVHQVTIPEGLTSQQIVKRLMENELLTGNPQIPAEGTLLPETYQITRGQSRDEVLRRMADEQKKVLAAIWAKRASDLPLRSPQELVTLASIVEKETGKDAERERVAAVFVNRLNRKMKLQSDPTIIYGIVGGRGSLGRSISRTDITTPTAYNTYAIDGLPPGPIANPGREALAAAANPARTKDLYFVADGTGGHAFAETLNDHNRNVARWRAIEQGNAPATPPSTSPAN